MKRVHLDRNDLAIREMAYRYCRTLKAVEYAHAIGDDDDLLDVPRLGPPRGRKDGGRPPR